MPFRQAGLRWLHGSATALLAALSIGTAVAVAAGVLEIRRVPHEPPPPAPVAAAPVAAAPVASQHGGPPHVREVEEARGYFGVLGQEARLFRYEGGDLEAWVEVETGGETTSLARVESSGLRPGGEPPRSGYLAWVRRKERDEEVWVLAVGACDKDGKLVGSVRDTFAPPRPGVGVSVSGSSARDNGYAVFQPDGVAVLDWYNNPAHAGTGTGDRRVQLKCRFVR